MLTGQRDEKDCFEYSRSREDRKFTHLTSWTPCVRHHLFIIISFIVFFIIQTVFTYWGTLGLCWSRSRKSRIESIERRSQKVIGGNYQVQTVESLIKRQSCQLVFDCLQDNVCTPFKGYFTKIEHNINTRNNGCSLKLPKAKLEFGRRRFAFQRALVSNTLPRHLRNLNSRFLFKSNLKEFFNSIP